MKLLRGALQSTALVGLLVVGLVTATSGPSSAAKTNTAKDYYVSLGDSYAAGYQAISQGVGHNDTNGFAYQVVTLAKKSGYHFTLMNFGCDGATTTSILKTVGCKGIGPGATPYPTQTQAAVAEQFIASHRRHVGLITVSISGNDVTSCATQANPTSCVLTALTTIKANLAILLPALRTAAGPGVPIVGTTYPDVILGLYNSTKPALKSLATLSITVFRSLLNPALLTAYQAVNGSFVDVTEATGAYIPLSKTTTLAPYGTIPVAVAKVCELTYYCKYMNIHPKTPGYTVIAKLVVGTLPKH